MKLWKDILCRIGIHRTEVTIHAHKSIPGWGMKIHRCKHCGKWVKEDFWCDPEKYPASKIREMQECPF